MQKTKVLIFGMTSIVGGIETFLMNMYDNINLKNLQIDFLVPGKLEKKYKDKIESKNGKVYETEKIRKHPIKAIKQIRKIYKDNNYDIIHLNLCNAFFFIYALPAVILNKNKPRILVHSHNGGDKQKGLHIISKPLLNHYCTDFIACSDVAARWMFTKRKMKKNKVLLINNAINADKFLYNENLRKNIREKYDIKNEFVVGHVGRFEEQKNHAFLVDVFQQICKERENVKLLLVGTGSLEDKIKEKVKQLKISDKVIFAGVCTNVNEMYQAMDVFVLPSIFEGLPVSGIEAQTSGLKCLFSDTITKEVAVTSNVKFIPINVKEIWAVEIEKIIDNKYNRNNMINEIRKSNYDMKEEVKKIEKLYLREEKK